MANVVEGLFQQIIAIFKVPSEFTATLVPENFTSSATIEMNGSYTVDWGDGIPISYTSQAIATPSGDVLIVGSNAATHIRLLNDRWTSVDITAIGSITSLNDFCSGNTKITSFVCVDMPLVLDVSDAWIGCTGLTSFPNIDMSGATDFSDAWNGCTGLTDFPANDCSSGLDFEDAWNGCTGLTNFGFINCSSGTNFRGAWRGCNNSSFTTFPLLDFSSATSIALAWANCVFFTGFPLINTSSVLTCASAWFDLIRMTTFPALDLSSCTSIAGAWHDCDDLTSFPLITFGSVLNATGAWEQCTGLTSFPLLDLSTCTNFNSTWRDSMKSTMITFPAIDFTAGLTFRFCFEGQGPRYWPNKMETGAGTDFHQMFYNTNLICLKGLDTTGVSGSNLIFNNNSPNGPTNAEQDDLEDSDGADYTNAGSCPP